MTTKRELSFDIKTLKTHTMNTQTESCPPPCQVLELVTRRLDPPVLAVAACVCKSWWAIMSTDHIWKPFCSAAYPALSHLHAAAYPALSHLHAASNPAVTYCKLFSLGRTAHRRRHKKSPVPQLSMHDLTFAMDIFENGDESRVATIVMPGAQLKPNLNGTFRFEIEVGETVAFESVNKLRITWNVLLSGFRSVFTMLDCKEEGSYVLVMDKGWFTKNLPAVDGCCVCSNSERMVADVKLGMKEKEDGGGRRMVVEKISLGVLNMERRRYVGVGDMLRYLVCFLMP